MLKVLLFLLLINTYCSGSNFLIDTPSANTLQRGHFSTDFIYYQDAILIDFNLGLTNNMTLGLPLDIHNAIGTGNVNSSFPPTISANIKLIDLYKVCRISIGYFDPYGYKKSSREDNVWIEGVYLSYTKPFLFLAQESLFNTGVSLDLKGGYYIFTSTELGLSEEFRVIGEFIHKIKNNKENKLINFINLGIKYYIFPQLYLQLSLRTPSQDNTTERLIKIGYYTKFF